jgi:hypothetical protein
MGGDRSRDDFVNRVAEFIETTDPAEFRAEWGSKVFEDVTTWVWDQIPSLVQRLSVLGDRSAPRLSNFDRES